MSKHTPGPWKVDRVIKAKYDSDSGEKLPDRVSLFVYPDNAKKENFNLAVVNSYCVPEAEANARLIAAAPEMLEEIKLLIGGYQNKNGVRDWLKEGKAAAAREQLDVYIGRLQAVIAKATGGAE